MSKSPDPNEVDMTELVRVTDDDKFDPNAVDYHPEGSPVDEFATRPLTAPSAGAPDDDEDDKFAPDLGDDAEDFPDPDLSLLDDFLSDDDCLERIDDEDITGEVPVVEGDKPDDSGALCLSPSEALIGIEADGISNHCGPVALMDDHQSVEDILNSIPLPRDYVPGKFRELSADEPRPKSEVVIRSNGVRQTFAQFLSELPEDYCEPGSIEIND